MIGVLRFFLVKYKNLRSLDGGRGHRICHMNGATKGRTAHAMARPGARVQPGALPVQQQNTARARP